MPLQALKNFAQNIISQLWTTGIKAYY